MGKRGPQPVSAQDVFFLAQSFYWDFRALARGLSRQVFDNKYFEKSVEAIEKLQLSDADRVDLRQWIEEEIRKGNLDEVERETRLRLLEQDQLFVKREIQRRTAAEDSARTVKVPAERDVLKKLLQAKTAARVRQICKDAFTTIRAEVRAGDYREIVVENWPLASGHGSMFPEYLSKYAEQFIAAKSDPRFPRSDRPSNELKQLWFLSRALAGARFNVTPRTAVNILGSKRPEVMFQESMAGKPVRRQSKAKRVL